MPDDVKPDDPSDSAETLRIMVDLERHADMHAPTLSDSADVMDEARHRLAVLQQACNAYPGLVARVAALEAENARLRELVRQAYITGACDCAGGLAGPELGARLDAADRWPHTEIAAALAPKEPQ